MRSGILNALLATSWRTATPIRFGTRLHLLWTRYTRTLRTTAPGWSWTATGGWESVTLTTPTPTALWLDAMTANDGSAQEKHTETAKLCLG